jgi:hypothetical protein
LRSLRPRRERGEDSGNISQIQSGSTTTSSGPNSPRCVTVGACVAGDLNRADAARIAWWLASRSRSRPRDGAERWRRDLRMRRASRRPGEERSRSCASLQTELVVTQHAGDNYVRRSAAKGRIVCVSHIVVVSRVAEFRIVVQRLVDLASQTVILLSQPLVFRHRRFLLCGCHYSRGPRRGPTRVVARQSGARENSARRSSPAVSADRESPCRRPQ